MLNRHEVPSAQTGGTSMQTPEPRDLVPAGEWGPHIFSQKGVPVAEGLLGTGSLAVFGIICLLQILSWPSRCERGSTERA